MDKNSAINLIDKTFNNAFDEAQFTNFIQNLLNDFEIKPNKYSGNTIWEDQRDHVSYYKRIGKYIDPEGEALDVLIVQVKNVSKLERARTALRNFVIKHLNNFEKDYALVAFYSKEDDGFDWRFSFIKMEHQSYLDEEKQKVKMRKEFTPAKRYSFLVGKYEKSHTAKTQLLPLLQNIANNPTISELEKAFSIERVTDEFFEQYKSLYIKVYEYFEKQDLSIFQNNELDASGFTKKLLGQIVFLYFLQKKGWLGVPKDERWGNGDKHFVQKLFEKAQKENLNFFKDYLQYLFYEALAKERDNENSYYPRFNCRIPFLNGGLFEAQYDWKNANISIPTDLFRNDEKNKSGDIGTGILDVFDRYNFTIKEDEPLDKEVAVDPEMLGKVFENMLEIKERKSKGAFYTPREIVHYMCQESLIHYLDNALNNYNNAYQEIGADQTNMFGNEGNKGQQSIQSEINEIKVPKEDIEQYIREGHLALENDVRVAARGETKTYQFQLPESVRNNADIIDKKLTEIRICDPAIGSGAFPVGLLHELVTAQLVLKPHLSNPYLNNKLIGFGFNERESVSESRYVYRLKKHIIQESIYGVDIDRSAIDIARLRLWLSLVVDEDDLEPIETLPNLDYKIVCGNSLVGLPPQGADRYPTLKDELETLKKKFYKETNEQEKKRLRNEINNKIKTVLETAEDFEGYPIDFDYELFFSEVWKEKGGFDVVIGNPPYKIEYDKSIKSIYEKLYNTFLRNNDIYVAFFQKGFLLLNDLGSLNYITPNTYLNGDYFINLRKLIVQNLNIIEIIDFKSHSVFKDPTVFVSISHISNNLKNNNHLYKEYNGNLITDDFKQIKKSKESYESLIPKHPIFNKILEQSTVNLDNVFLIKDVGFNYWTKGGGKNRKGNSIGKRVFLKEKQNENDIPYLKGKQIQQYSVDKAENYLRYNYVEFLDPDYDTFRFSEDILLTNPKIIYRQTANKIIAAIDNESRLCDKTVHTIINKKGNSFDLDILLGFLNSELYLFIYRQISQETEGRTFSQVKTTYLKKMPFKYFDNYDFKKTISYLKESNVIVEVKQFYLLVVDAVVYEIFFKQSFQSANKSILKHLSNLKPINDSMSEEEKLGIIQSEYERLYHPDHPVRFAIETLDSIEEVRIIREALK